MEHEILCRRVTDRRHVTVRTFSVRVSAVSEARTAVTRRFLLLQNLHFRHPWRSNNSGCFKRPEFDLTWNIQKTKIILPSCERIVCLDKPALASRDLARLAVPQVARSYLRAFL